MKGVCICAKDMLQDFIDRLLQCAARQGTARVENQVCMHIEISHLLSHITFDSAQHVCVLQEKKKRTRAI